MCPSSESPNTLANASADFFTNKITKIRDLANTGVFNIWFYDWNLQWNLDLTMGQGTEKIVRYNEVLFHIFYYYWGNENRSLYQGLRYVQVH